MSYADTVGFTDAFYIVSGIQPRSCFQQHDNLDPLVDEGTVFPRIRSLLEGSTLGM
jgi:hypothetical protein